MSTQPSHSDLRENNLIGNILNPDVDDFFNLRADIGKSVSAPPINFPQLMFSPTLKPPKSEVPESFALDNHNDAKQSTGPLMSFLSQRQQLHRSTSFQPSQSLEEELFNQQNYAGLQSNSFLPIVQRSQSQNFHQSNNIQTSQNTLFYSQHPMSRNSPESPLRSPTHPSNYHIQQQDNSPAYYTPPNIRFGPMSPYAQFPPENPEIEDNFILNSPSGSYFHQNGEYYNYNMSYPGSTDNYMLAREDAGHNNNKILQPQFDKNNNRKLSYPPTNPYGSQHYNYSPENHGYPNSNMNSNLRKFSKEGSFSGSQNKKQSAKYSANPKGSYSSHSTPFQRENLHPNMKNHHQTSQKTRPKSNSANVNIQQMLANVSEASKDQNGSRIIQQYFEGASREERDAIFQQVMDHANTLFTDMFGNYVIQKILQLGTLHQKLRIYEIMKGKIFALSQHMYSCRIVQKALEEFSNNGLIQDQILKELGADILSLIQNQNGNHVVQKCFETIPSEKLRFIIEEITENIDKLSFHAFECRIIQKILEFSTFEQVSELMKKIMERCFECCQSQYGNYVMQHVLEKGSSAEKDKLLDVLSNNFVKLSLDKFASNVTEKSIIHSNAEYRKLIVERLLNTNYQDKLSLVVLINDQYGNYVIQRLFEYSDKGVRRAIFDTLVNKDNFEEARKTGFGQHVSSHIEKLMNIQKI